VVNPSSIILLNYIYQKVNYLFIENFEARLLGGGGRTTAIESVQKVPTPQKLDKALPCIANNTVTKELSQFITKQIFSIF
jgi:hypothetical protein